MKRATIWLLLIIMLPIKIYAKECTDGELASLKKLAANITYSYEYYFKDNELYYDITIANLYEDTAILQEALSCAEWIKGSKDPEVKAYGDKVVSELESKLSL